MNFIKVRAHGKINLGLDIVRKREDGYHDVRMIMQTVGIFDGISINRRPSKSSEITVSTNLKFLPTDGNNLAVKAARVLMDEFNITDNIDISIKKMIPVSAGMAGGSADCAAIFRGLNKMYDLGLTNEDLKIRGVRLGADVPYCIEEGTFLSEGIGDILTMLPPMPDCGIILVKPHVNISTKFVYEHMNVAAIKNHPDIDGMVGALLKGDIYGITNRMSNVMELFTASEYPVIEEIKAKLMDLGALNSIMSGSGSTVFAIFDDPERCKNAYNVMKQSGLGRQVYITEPYNII